jgi:hypothetical protein
MTSSWSECDHLGKVSIVGAGMKPPASPRGPSPRCANSGRAALRVHIPDQIAFVPHADVKRAVTARATFDLG